MMRGGGSTEAYAHLYGFAMSNPNRKSPRSSAGTFPSRDYVGGVRTPGYRYPGGPFRDCPQAE